MSHKRDRTCIQVQLSVYTTLPPVQSKRGFPGGSVVKNPPANVRDMGSVPGLGISTGEGNGNPL